MTPKNSPTKNKFDMKNKTSTKHENGNFAKPILSVVLIKGIALGLFGVFIIAGFLQIVKGYDSELSNDDWSIAIISITWYAYIFAKTYLEWYRIKNYR
jgi:hypothetical protein